MRSTQSDLFEERIINFSVSIIGLTQKLPSVPYTARDQVIRSAASMKANYAEAQNAISRADFKNKIYIAKKEAADTRYWLQLIEKLSSPELLAPYLKESLELLLILQRTVSTLRAKHGT